LTEKKRRPTFAVEKTVPKMTASELYEQTWQAYTSLPGVGKESLSKYCKAHKVHYRGH